MRCYHFQTIFYRKQLSLVSVTMELWFLAQIDRQSTISHFNVLRNGNSPEQQRNMRSLPLPNPRLALSSKLHNFTPPFLVSPVLETTCASDLRKKSAAARSPLCARILKRNSKTTAAYAFKQGSIRIAEVIGTYIFKSFTIYLPTSFLT